MKPHIRCMLHALTAAGIAGIGVRQGGGSTEAAIWTALAAALKDVYAFLSKPEEKGEQSHAEEIASRRED